MSDLLGLKKARTIRWWHFWKWPRAVRHAWVTRKCFLGGTPCISDEPEIRARAVAVMKFETDWRPYLEAGFEYEPTAISSDPNKFPTVLTREELDAIARNENLLP